MTPTMTVTFDDSDSEDQPENTSVDEMTDDQIVTDKNEKSSSLEFDVPDLVDPKIAAHKEAMRKDSSSTQGNSYEVGSTQEEKITYTKSSSMLRNYNWSDTHKKELDQESD